MSEHVHTTAYAMFYKIDNVEFYVDPDGDLTSNIKKADLVDTEEQAQKIIKFYNGHGIDLQCRETKVAI